MRTEVLLAITGSDPPAQSSRPKAGRTPLQHATRCAESLARCLVHIYPNDTREIGLGAISRAIAAPYEPAECRILNNYSASINLKIVKNLSVN